jgi:hypothetical protein
MIIAHEALLVHHDTFPPVLMIWIFVMLAAAYRGHPLKWFPGKR